MDVDTREIVDVYLSDRDEKSARKLWESLPSVYRQCAVAYTDFWSADGAVFFRQRHQAAGKADATMRAQEGAPSRDWSYKLS